jgi:hypothetical protein
MGKLIISDSSLRSKRWQIKGLLLLILFPVSLYTGSREILDLNARPHSVLTPIAPDLDIIGIDVVQNSTSEVQAKGRPILAPLLGFQIGGLSSYYSRWVRDLFEDKYSLLMAAENRNNPSTSSFKSVWDNADKDKRIFISFASEDVESAQQIKNILEGKGYTVFIYLDRHGSSTLNAEEIGYYLRTTGNGLVIDTKIARTKEGVLAETIAYNRYKLPRDSSLIEENTRLLEEINSRVGDKQIELPSYNSLLPRFKNYFLNVEGEELTTAQVQARIAQRFNIRANDSYRTNLENTIKSNYLGQFTNEASDFTSDLAYNKLLKSSLIELGAQLLFPICSRCHLPVSFPVCLAPL